MTYKMKIRYQLHEKINKPYGLHVVCSFRDRLMAKENTHVNSVRTI